MSLTNLYKTEVEKKGIYRNVAVLKEANEENKPDGDDKPEIVLNRIGEKPGKY